MFLSLTFQNTKMPKETEHLVTEAGRKAVLIPGDIGERSVTKEVAQKAIDAFGGIDILVNNAEPFNAVTMFRLCKAILRRGYS